MTTMDESSEHPEWPAEQQDGTAAARRSDRSRDGRGRDEGLSGLQKIGLAFFALATFVFFLALKLPEARIQNLVIAHLRILAQEQGFLFSAEKVRVGVLLGPSLKLYNVELKSADDEKQSLKIAYLRISPRLFSLLSSIKKIGISADLLDGSVSGTVGGSTTGSLYADLSLDSIDLGASTLVKKVAPVSFSGKVNGSVYLSLDGTQPQASEGSIKLKLQKLNLPAQRIAFGQLSGIGLPKIDVSEANVNIALSNGQFTIKELEVGKEGSSDDVFGKVTGEGTLSRSLERSTVNVKAVFGFSKAVLSSFSFLDMVLGAAKQPDGKYAYRIQGTFSNLEPIPGQ